MSYMSIPQTMTVFLVRETPAHVVVTMTWSNVYMLLFALNVTRNFMGMGTPAVTNYAPSASPLWLRHRTGRGIHSEVLERKEVSLMFYDARTVKSGIKITCPHCKFINLIGVSYVEDAIHDDSQITCVVCDKRFRILTVPLTRATANVVFVKA